MPFDADTHTAQDAPASREALNAALMEARAAFAAVIQAERAVEMLRRVAIGSPECGELIAMRNALRGVQTSWPLRLHQQTDAERARTAQVSRATEAHLTALYERGELSTIGD